ncbi:hypothetical protein [Adhaeribacter radiodurans]|uniref:DUF922 domain-containing protein n=1 Tax=Adhaeribacter radiodurans TaxID=2745197 RepID=A0A7L7LAK7_9BACT|nr:hypothetical protein [Adhaeribacter radiodurans]QMU29866.1 hypothetical protein HUW48_18365 [Adhaeribacter radiodurans]
MTHPFKSTINLVIKYKSSVIRYKFIYWVLVCLTLVCGAATQPTVKMAPIVLRNMPLPFTPKEFYIAEVKDEREDRKAVAYLIPAPAAPGLPLATTPQPIDLQGGGLAGIREFIQRSWAQNNKLRPLIIRLKECKVVETPSATKGRVDGHISIALAYDYRREGKPVHLVEYRGGARYSRPANSLTVIEPTLRQSLIAGIRYINIWMDQEAGRNEKLATGIQVNFTDYVRNAEDDTVFYTPNRPLKWNDFTATPRGGKYAALVFPSFAYQGGSEVINGVIQLNLTVKVYVIRSSSWVKDAARDAYSLNHEQRHFDIVKLVAERFKRKIQPDSLTLDDYNSIVQYKFIESFREMNKMQEKYDGETGHGTNAAMQETWNSRIDADLRKYGIKQ